LIILEAVPALSYGTTWLNGHFLSILHFVAIVGLGIHFTAQESRYVDFNPEL